MTTINIKKRLIVFLCIAMGFTLSGFGQSARLDLNNLQKLGDKASSVNDVTLDGSMLQFASKFMNDGDSEEAQVKSLLKDLQGIYIKNFEFEHDNEYSPADVEAIRSQLKSPVWVRMVESRSRHDHEINEIYLAKEGDKVIGLAIVVVAPKELTVVNIVGPIDINKISQLTSQIVPRHDKDKDDKGKDKDKTTQKKGQKAATESAHENDED
jgi:flagellar assembly factor FliW